MNKEIKVRGGKIHPVNESFVISDGGGWLAGSYDSIESATLGIKNKSKDDWSYLETLRDEVNIKQCRDITVEDFK